MRNLVYFIVIIIVFSACNRQVARDKLIEYIADPENKCVQTSSYKDLIINAYYRPYDLLVYGEILSLKVKNENSIDSIINQYNSNMYFMLSLKSGESNFLQKYITNNVVYTRLVSYFNYGIQSDIQLIDNNNNKIHPTDCVFMRNYGISDVNNILLIFNKTELQNSRNFTINLNSKWNDIGTHKFHFNIKDLESIPTIDFKNIKIIK